MGFAVVLSDQIRLDAFSNYHLSEKERALLLFFRTVMIALRIELSEVGSLGLNGNNICLAIYAF